MAANGEQYGEGPGFPNDDELRAQQECYGTSFDLSEVECTRACVARDRCILRCVRVELPARAAEKRLDVRLLSAPQIVELLAMEATIGENTAEVYRAVIRGKPPAAALPAPPEPTEEDRLLDDLDEAEDEAADAMLDQLDSAEPPEKPATGEKEKEPEDMKTTKKTAKKAKAKKAKVKAAKVKVAKVAKKTLSSGPSHGAPDEALTAWVRERARSSWVAGLRNGQQFSRTWKGREYVLTVRQDSRQYEVNGAAFPTVYAATAHVVGMQEFKGKDGTTRSMPAWSSQRFWAAAAPAKKKKAAPAKKGKAKKKS